MFRPIGWIGGLLGSDPVRGDIGKKRNLGSAKADAPETIGKCLEDRVHHGGMERVRRMETSARDAAIRQRLFELINQIKRTGNDALVGRVDSREGKTGRYREFAWRDWHREHGA